MRKAVPNRLGRSHVSRIQRYSYWSKVVCVREILSSFPMEFIFLPHAVAQQRRIYDGWQRIRGEGLGTKRSDQLCKIINTMLSLSSTTLNCRRHSHFIFLWNHPVHSSTLLRGAARPLELFSRGRGLVWDLTPASVDEAKKKKQGWLYTPKILHQMTLNDPNWLEDIYCCWGFTFDPQQYFLYFSFFPFIWKMYVHFLLPFLSAFVAVKCIL